MPDGIYLWLYYYDIKLVYLIVYEINVDISFSQKAIIQPKLIQRTRNSQLNQVVSHTFGFTKNMLNLRLMQLEQPGMNSINQMAKGAQTRGGLPHCLHHTQRVILEDNLPKTQLNAQIDTLP